MAIKKIFFLITIIFLISCSEEITVFEPENLQEYISNSTNIELGGVIACAASEDTDTAISYVFYYPVETATNIQYFETEDINVDKDNFELYKPLTLEKEDVFNGYLERFIRNNPTETWCVVTYEIAGKIHVSNPIRLKNATQPTEWSTEVTINSENLLMPFFMWQDGAVAENAIYFEVITDATNNFLSGTYTFDTWFQFYKLENVVLNITTATNPILSANEMYNFTMMGVSEDNWVNLVIQKPFIAE